MKKISIIGFSIFCLLFCLLSFCYTEEQSQIVFMENFEEPGITSLYTRLINHDKLSIADGEGVGGSKGLKADYVGYEAGSHRIVVRQNLDERGLEYTLCYDVKFDKEFQFVRSGKLHGLGPERPISGGNPMKPEGWSARVTFARDGLVSSYLYCQNKRGKYGASVRSDQPVFEKDRYYAVTLHIQLNDPVEDANGFARIYIDGELVVNHENVQYRGVDGENTLISNFLFSTFHGGSNESYAPKDENGEFTTVYAYFDNIAVYRGDYIRLKPGG